MALSITSDPEESLRHLKEVEVHVLSPMDSIVDINEIEELGLPAVDRGRRAWAFLFGAFMIEGLLYGKASMSFPWFHMIRLMNYRVSFDLWSVSRILSNKNGLWDNPLLPLIGTMAIVGSTDLPVEVQTYLTTYAGRFKTGFTTHDPAHQQISTTTTKYDFNRMVNLHNCNHHKQFCH
jgi:hypothetical protein